MTKVRVVSEPYFYMRRTWEVQRPPYKNALPYSFTKQYVTKLISRGALSPYPVFGPVGVTQTGDATRDTAYSRLTSALSDKSEWGVNLLEAHESIDMITGAARALTDAAKAVRRGDVGGVVRALGHGSHSPPNANRVRRIVGGSKPFANKWLALHFGAVPLYQDIGAAVNTLQKTDFDTHVVKGSHTDHYRNVQVDVHNQYGIVRQGYDITFSAKFGVQVRITNPNAYLANQLGFVNPLAVAWESVPYSFVVDWFSNVGQCLSAMTDFVGLDIINAYTTTSEVGTGWYFEQDNGYFDAGTFGVRDSAGNSVFIQRSPVIIGPTLALRPFKGFSTIRAATAISLLLQHL